MDASLMKSILIVTDIEEEKVKGGEKDLGEEEA
jgi:hypothetical protein